MSNTNLKNHGDQQQGFRNPKSKIRLGKLGGTQADTLTGSPVPYGGRPSCWTGLTAYFPQNPKWSNHPHLYTCAILLGVGIGPTPLPLPLKQVAVAQAAPVNQLSEPSPSSRLLPPGTKTIKFTVTTSEPAVVKADTADKPLAQLSTQLTSADGKTHTLSMAAQADKPYSFYIKAAPKSQPNQAWNISRTVNYRVMHNYKPPFPRIFTIWWPGATSPRTEVTADKVAKLAVNVHGRNELVDPQTFFEARRRNPHVKILNQLYSTYGGGRGLFEKMQAADKDPKRPELYGKVFVRNVDGSPWMFGSPSHEVYNFANPAVVNYLLQLNMELWQKDLLVYDGAFLDNCWRGFDGVMGDTSKIDLNRDGQADNPAQRDRAFEAGQQDLLRGLRQQMPNAVLICNAILGPPDKTFKPGQAGSPLSDRNGKAYSYAQHINGVEWEDDLSRLAAGNYWQEFGDFIAWYKAWNRSPWSMNLMASKLPDGSTKANHAYKDLRQMCFGLATALMGDSLYMHNGFGFYSWFDEYDAKLGYPKTSFGQQISGTPVWRRDFSGGVALVNSSKTETVTVDLGGTYKAIPGKQDPKVNNGATITKVTIPPLDGRILINNQ